MCENCKRIVFKDEHKEFQYKEQNNTIETDIEPESKRSGPPELLIHIVFFIGGIIELIHLFKQ
jgi:hypothetical protein